MMKYWFVLLLFMFLFKSIVSAQNQNNTERYGCQNQNNIFDQNEDTCAGVEQEMLLGIHISPNPVGNNCVVKLKGNKQMEHVTIKIFNLQGTLMRQEINYSGSFAQIKNLNFPNGLYILQLEINNSIIATEKFVKG